MRQHVSARSDVIVADGMGRVAHYYPNTMALLNVSRVRVSDGENISVGLEYIKRHMTWGPMTVFQTCFGVDQYRNYLFTVVC